MDVRDKIDAGAYDHRVSFINFDRRSVEYKEQRAAYNKESETIRNYFYNDCCDDIGLCPSKDSSRKLFERAWEECHSIGFYDVLLRMGELSEFVDEMMELRKQED